jgi:branched-chain amino acid transport system permease protein
MAGAVLTPVTFTSFDVGVMFGLKGFSAAVLGGLGSGFGAIFGGFLLGVMESLTAGLVSSGFKDAVAFLVLLFVLFFRPRGIFGGKGDERA